MKIKIFVLATLFICLSCIEKTSVTIADSSKIDLTIGNFDTIYSFSMQEDRKAFIMIQSVNEVAKVYTYNLTEEEKNDTQKLIDEVVKSNCNDSEKLSTNEDYFMSLKKSDTIEYFYTSGSCKNRLVLENLKRNLIKNYINNKPILLFESTNNVVLPPPPPLPEVSLDSLKFFKNDK